MTKNKKQLLIVLLCATVMLASIFIYKSTEQEIIYNRIMELNNE